MVRFSASTMANCYKMSEQHKAMLVRISTRSSPRIRKTSGISIVGDATLGRSDRRSEFYHHDPTVRLDGVPLSKTKEDADIVHGWYVYFVHEGILQEMELVVYVDDSDLGSKEAVSVDTEQDFCVLAQPPDLRSSNSPERKEDTHKECCDESKDATLVEGSVAEVRDL